MNTLQTIPVLNLSLAFIPVLVVLVILFFWSTGFRTAIHAVSRMLIQLLLIGYALTYIFTAEDAWLVAAILSIMLIASSWISLRPVIHKDRLLYIKSFTAIVIGGVSTLLLVTQFVLELDPWFLPQYMIPLAGMIFANSMNSISQAAERLESELVNKSSYPECRQKAFKAALIPQINSLFAVGLVSLPGMMTGQILSGISPLIAVRYQIVVMCMIFGSAGISAACYLLLYDRVKPGNA